MLAELLAVFGRRDSQLFLEIAVEASEGIEAAFVGNFKDGHFIVLQEITCFADAVLIDVIVVGQTDNFLEIPRQISVVVAGVFREIREGTVFVVIQLDELENIVQEHVGTRIRFPVRSCVIEASAEGIEQALDLENRIVFGEFREKFQVERVGAEMVVDGDFRRDFFIVRADKIRREYTKNMTACADGIHGMDLVREEEKCLSGLQIVLVRIHFNVHASFGNREDFIAVVKMGRKFEVDSDLYLEIVG
jgi:hypothetical protein